jgi:hypothetical protein
MNEVVVRGSEVDRRAGEVAVRGDEAVSSAGLGVNRYEDREDAAMDMTTACGAMKTAVIVVMSMTIEIVKTAAAEATESENESVVGRIAIVGVRTASVASARMKNASVSKLARRMLDIWLEKVGRQSAV